jgi:hypothetical protein
MTDTMTMHSEIVEIMTRQHYLIYNNLLCLLFVHFMMVIMLILYCIHTTDPEDTKGDTKGAEVPKGDKLLADKC